LRQRLNAVVFCLGVIGFTNPPTGQALVSRATKQIGGAFCVADLESSAAIVTEIELGKITVKMCFAAMLVDAEHTTL